MPEPSSAPSSAVATEHPTGQYRYWAFISYSHKDEAFARRLQAYLETYRVPKALVGRTLRGEQIPPRLFPVFRDRDELPGASDLGAKLREELQRSRYLIVVCSANSAGSRWVDEEIQYFQALGRADRVLCIVSDDHGADGSVQAATQCFPPALRLAVETDEPLDPDLVEPIAADARATGDGWKHARLKLVAGILGVDFDELRNRERRRQRVRRAQLAVLTAVIGIAATFLYVFLSDAGAPLPGAQAIRRLLDRYEIAWSRPVHGAADVQATAGRLRSALVSELLDRWRQRAWDFPVFDVPNPSKTLLDVWLASQSATGALRPGTAAARQSAADMTAIFDGAFLPGVPIETGGQLRGWRTGHYLPSGNQIIGSGTASGAGFWLAAGLAVTLARDDLVSETERPRALARLAQAQAVVDSHYGNDGGWNFFPNQFEPEAHSTYASLLALLALLETRAAGLPWNGSLERRDMLLQSTAAWLIGRFDERSNPRGWRGAPTDTGAPVDGLTLQAYAELLRAEAEAGIQLPDGIVDAIAVQVPALVERPADYPIVNKTYFRPYRRADGLVMDGQESIYYGWHPWAIETSSWWIRRLERSGAPREDLVAARRALGYLIVDLGDEIVDGILDGVAYPIAETAYALAIVESP